MSSIERRLELRARDRAQLDPLAEQLAQPLRDVEIGREVAALGQHHAAPGPQLQRGGDQLEQVDRDRIADHDLVRLGADQARDLGAEPLRQIDPAVPVPARDQVLAPLPADDVVEDRRGRLGQRAERVAVQIDHALGQRKALAPRRQRIAGIEGFELGTTERTHRA